MTRAEFSKRTRAVAFNRSGAKCERCGNKLFPGSVEYHHVLEAMLGGEATADNCEVLCKKCHNGITSGRRFEIDKTRRIGEKAAGLRSKSSRPMPGSRASKWKRRMDGTAERRM